MSLRPIQVGLGRPISYPVNPNSTFEPGQIAQIQQIGNDVVIGVSDGIAPFGIIDDIKTTAFSMAVIDEIVIIEVPTIFDGYNWVSTMVGVQELQNADIVPNSFVADFGGLILNPVNGTLRVPVGTAVNYQTEDSPQPNAVRTITRYAFRVPNIPGEDSTQGSGRMTVWFTRGIFQTDQFETDVPFQVNATLFVSPRGKLTTALTSPNQPGVAMCIVPPTAHNGMLEFIWF